MKTFKLLLVTMLFCAVTAVSASDTELNKEVITGSKAVFDYISQPHDIYRNPYCVAAGIRHDDWNDMRIAAGYRMKEIEKALVLRLNDDGTYVHFYKIKVFYIDSEGNTIEPLEFGCLLPESAK